MGRSWLCGHGARRGTPRPESGPVGKDKSGGVRKHAIIIGEIGVDDESHRQAKPKKATRARDFQTAIRRIY